MLFVGRGALRVVSLGLYPGEFLMWVGFLVGKEKNLELLPMRNPNNIILLA